MSGRINRSGDRPRPRHEALREQRAASDRRPLASPSRPGEICVLIGPSGGGKTTAMKMINRLISITEGDITIDGTEREVARPDRAAARDRLRDPADRPVPAHDGRGQHRHRAAAARLGQARAPAPARASCSSSSGLDPDEHAKRYPAQLSGGQRQRVGLARAMAADPPLMLMDEPFGAIDPITRERLQNDFLRLHREVRKTVIFVTHDIDEAIKMGDRDLHPAPGRRPRPVRHAGGDPRRARRRVRGPVRRRRPRPQAARAAPAWTRSTCSPVPAAPTAIAPERRARPRCATRCR